VTPPYFADSNGAGYLQADAAPKKRAFKKFQFRGVDLDALLDYSTEKFTEMLNARQRRKASRTARSLPFAARVNAVELSGLPDVPRFFSPCGTVAAMAHAERRSLGR
jgi:hypothetical protein